MREDAAAEGHPLLDLPGRRIARAQQEVGLAHLRGQPMRGVRRLQPRQVALADEEAGRDGREQAGRDQHQGRHRGQPAVPACPLAEPLAQRGLRCVLQRQVVELAPEVLVQLAARIDSGVQGRGAGSAGRSIRRRARPRRSTGATGAAAPSRSAIIRGRISRTGPVWIGKGCCPVSSSKRITPRE